jgi:undecaprenyl-diphosphatase
MPLRPFLVVAAVAAVLFTLLAAVVTAGDGRPLGVDRALHDWALGHRTPAGEDAWLAVTDTGSRYEPLAVAGVAGLLAAAARHRRWWWLGAAAGVAALTLCQLARYALVNLIDRPRPPVADWATHVNNPSLPSGHATSTALAAFGLAAALLRYGHRRATRVLAVAVPAAWAAAVGVSRVALGVHWATDVLAGWLLATALACLVLPLLGRALDRLPAPR